MAKWDLKGCEAEDTKPLTFRYTNWRGETAVRTATPVRIWWGSTDWHPEPGWLMTAHDHGKDAERDFALADCDFSGGGRIQDLERRLGEARKANCELVVAEREARDKALGEALAAVRGESSRQPEGAAGDEALRGAYMAIEALRDHPTPQGDDEAVRQLGIDVASGPDRTVVSYRCTKCGETYPTRLEPCACDRDEAVRKQVARALEAAGQMRLALAGYVSFDHASRAWDDAAAALSAARKGGA